MKAARDPLPGAVRARQQLAHRAPHAGAAGVLLQLPVAGRLLVAGEGRAHERGHAVLRDQAAELVVATPVRARSPTPMRSGILLPARSAAASPPIAATVKARRGRRSRAAAPARRCSGPGGGPASPARMRSRTPPTHRHRSPNDGRTGMVESGVPSSGPSSRPRPRTLAWVLGAAVAAVLTFALASTASAAEPPNQNDPCSTGGRNTCGTTGVGSYEHYRYGLRWFGDYRGAVAGRRRDVLHRPALLVPQARPTGYRQVADRGPARTATARPCRGATQRRWPTRSGPTGARTSARQQAAVMLYVHALMGDGAPGEVDPAGARPRGRARCTTRIARDAGALRTAPTASRSSCPRGLHGRRSRRPATSACSSAPAARRAERCASTLDGRRRRRAARRACAPATTASPSVAFTPTTPAAGVRVDGAQRAARRRRCRSSTRPATPAGRPQRPAPRGAGVAARSRDRRPQRRVEARCA